MVLAELVAEAEALHVPLRGDGNNDGDKNDVPACGDETGAKDLAALAAAAAT